jgi:hypothetical protein
MTVEGTTRDTATKHLSASARLLCDCLSQDGGGVSSERLAGLSPDAWPPLLEMARVQKVGALLYHRLVSRGWAGAVPPAALAAARQACRNTAAANLRLYEELAAVAAALRAADIPVIVLKGPHVASAVYGDPALRHMADLDLLVQVRDLERAADVVRAQGYVSQTPYTIGTILRTCHHLPPLIKARATTIELHWNIVPPGLPCEVEPAELWGRATPARIVGVDVLGLAADDLLLHLCLHTSYSDLFGLGLQPSCDIAETIRRHRDTLDWRRIIGCARRWRAARGVYLALRVANELVGAAVPDDVLDDLRPATFDETLLTAASVQILEGVPASWAITRHIASFSTSTSLTRKVGIVLRRLFVSPPELARCYGLAHDSPRVYLYYPVRLRGLLVRNWPFARALRRGDPEVVLTARRKARLASWLDASE